MGDADRLSDYRAKRDFDATPEPTGTRRQSPCSRRRWVAAVRGAGASRLVVALGPAARARGDAGVVGHPARHPSRPEAQPPGGAHGGPPARVPGLPRHDPEGPLRRGRDEDLGPRRLRAREVARGKGSDGRPSWRAGAGSLRAVSHGRQELDDPPDGPAAGPGAGDDAGRARADAGQGGQAAVRPVQVGVRGQVGRGPRRRLLPGRASQARVALGSRHHVAVPRGPRPGRDARRARGDLRRRGRRVRRRRAAELRAAAEADEPRQRPGGRAGSCATCPSPTCSSTCCGSTGTR